MGHAESIRARTTGTSPAPSPPAPHATTLDVDGPNLAAIYLAGQLPRVQDGLAAERLVLNVHLDHIGNHLHAGAR
jgi:hypothetical protein